MMTSKTAFASLGLLCGLGFLATACPATLDDECAEGACVAATSGEGGGEVIDGGGSDAPIPVDPCVNTPSDPKCLDESTALFVSAKANVAGADGSRAHPFKTIGAGLGAVSATRKRIYVCDGDYLENVSVKTAVSILGGLTCDWMGKGANPRIAPAKGVALSIAKSNGAVVTDVNVEGNADSLVDGDSAIGVFVSESQGVLLRRVGVKAGPGTKATIGADGDGSPNYTAVIATAGVATATSAGAEAPTCGTCVDTSLSAGGKGAASGGAGPLAGSATPAVGVDNSGGTVGGVCSDGKAGAPGVAAAAAAAALAPGSVKATGWESPLVAKKGTNGNPGQGGGGGGSTSAPALGGGSGGCGGCGGTGGAPGGNGGSSIGLLTFESDVTVEDGTLTAAAGGIGGIGGKGQDGQFRGSAGGGACAGGVGGHGAGGGGGGGGAGGHSAAVAHSGKAPTPKNTTLKHALGGDLGPGGGGGTSTSNAGATGGSGTKGLEADVLPL